MAEPSAGLHHITAICGDPAENVAFYTRVLGMRFIKKTVNFDDPGTYHLYYGDAIGSPGTALTFFPFAGAPAGRHGAGAPVEIGLAVPPDALAFWAERLAEHGVAFERATRFDEQMLTFHDPHGIALQLVGTASAADIEGRAAAAIPAEHAVRGFHGVGVWTHALDGTAMVLEEGLGFRRVATADDRVRFQAGDGRAPGAFVDVRVDPALAPERQGVGSIHHIAFRAADDDHEMALRDVLTTHGLNATPQIDRQYFHSVYFREPGGSLFEIATDGPGFTVDETAEALGTHLKLPEQYEARRAEIEAALPPL